MADLNSAQEFEAVTLRVQKLEGQIRRMWAHGIAALVVFGAAIYFVATGDVGRPAAGEQIDLRVVTAQEFRLEDADGYMRGRLRVVEDIASLTLFDASGQSRSVLVVRPDGVAGLGFADESGQLQVDIGVDPTGKPRVAFFDSGGNIVWSRPVSPGR